MSIKKSYLKNKFICKVTFTVTKKEANNASRITLVGDFNQWDVDALVMKPMKSGGFQTVLELEPGRSYQFRYLADGQRWMNEKEADYHTTSGFPDAENSVIAL